MSKRNQSFTTVMRAKPSGGKSRELGAAIKGLAVLVLLVVIAVTMVAFVFGEVVPMGTVGVRKIAFGPGQGLTARPLLPGYHWTIPGYSTIYEVPQTIQIIDFDRNTQGNPNSFGALDIPTVDGTTVDVDASVLYRFYDRGGDTDGLKHGGPADLINNVGATDVQWRKYLSQVAENELKRSMSALSTVDFYNPKLREERVRSAEKSMRDLLSPLGVDVQGVLVRRYTYREEIDQAIFKKNLQELEQAYNKVAGDFAEAQRDVNKVEVDGNVAIQNLDKRGRSEAEKIRSEGDLYRRQKIAEADLLVARARADVDRMRSEILAKVGSDVYVALQLAQVLASLKGGVVANVDPYDFDGWVKRLAGQSAAAETNSASAPAQPTAAPAATKQGEVSDAR
jgi:regulator of protease activity HflC (stomatin/prohibitin superfamily)